ncbi:H-type lectin domain-containing protein [Nostoc sp. UHCC 0702]|nr:H-type lectin domain-containing protein [Nostoc sp. UHCC 0702]
MAQWEACHKCFKFQTGNTKAWTENAGCNLSLASGERVYKQRITFPEEFTESVPTVTVSLAGEYGVNQRIKPQVNNVDSSGFDLEYVTSTDTKVCGVFVSWIAIERTSLSNKNVVLNSIDQVYMYVPSWHDNN